MLEEHLATVLDRERAGAVGILHTGLHSVHNTETGHRRVRNSRIDSAPVHDDRVCVSCESRVLAPYAAADGDTGGKIFRIAATLGTIDDVVGIKDPVGLDDDFRSNRCRSRRMDTAAADGRRIAAPVGDECARLNHDPTSAGTSCVVRIAQANAG